MKAINSYIKNKKVFKGVFLISLLISSFFIILSLAAILEDTVKILQQEDFVIGKVYDEKESDLEYEVDKGYSVSIENSKEIEIKEEYLEFKDPSGCANKVSFFVSFVNEKGIVYSIDQYGFGDKLVMPDLPLFIEEDDGTYELIWKENISYIVTSNATYHFQYVLK